MRTAHDDRLLRALKLLEAVHEPQVARLLARRGFDDAARREGFELLDRALGRHLPAAEPGPTVTVTDLIQTLDRWENTWFDVADAAWSRVAPELHRRLFRGLGKARGIEVVLGVQTFLDRLDDFEREATAESQAALRVLAQRGLHRAERERARALLHDIQTATPEPRSETLAERERARAELWAWYKDWAQTVRTVITKRSLRIALGLSPRRPQPANASAERSDESDAA